MLELYIGINPSLDAEQLKEVLSKISSFMDKVVDLKDWGVRKKIINPLFNNTIHSFTLQGFIDNIDIFEKNMKEVKEVIRYIICQVPDDINENLYNI